eukprot:9411948-Ditylum_brightwellii.AAC.1
MDFKGVAMPLKPSIPSLASLSWMSMLMGRGSLPLLGMAATTKNGDILLNGLSGSRLMGTEITVCKRDDSLAESAMYAAKECLISYHMLAPIRAYVKDGSRIEEISSFHWASYCLEPSQSHLGFRVAPSHIFLEALSDNISVRGGAVEEDPYVKTPFCVISTIPPFVVVEVCIIELFSALCPRE